MAKVKLPAELEPVTSDGYIGDAAYIKLTDTDNNQTRTRKLSDVVSNLDAVITNLDDKLGLTEDNANKTVASLITEAVEILRGTDDSKNLSSISDQVTELYSRLGNDITNSNTLYKLLNDIKTSLQGDDSDKSLKDLSDEISKAISSVKGTNDKDISSIWGKLDLLDSTVTTALSDIRGDNETTLSSLSTDVSTAVSNIRGTDGVNISDISDAIKSLREHINTISPPTITKAEHNGPSTYDISANIVPTLTVSIEINRPLESPLALYSETAISDTNKNGKISNDQNTTRKWTESWEPSKPQNCASGNAKVSVKIADTNDPTMIYAKKDVTFTFGSYVYYWSSRDDELRIPQRVTENSATKKLVNKNPSAVTFEVGETDSFLYYAYPYSSGEFIGFSAPNIAGFDDKYHKETSVNGIPYMIHRSVQKQNSDITVDIK